MRVHGTNEPDNVIYINITTTNSDYLKTTLMLFCDDFLRIQFLQQPTILGIQLLNKHILFT